MFCQKEIVSKIIEKGGDYLLSVKENQRDLYKEITTAINEPVFPASKKSTLQPFDSEKYDFVNNLFS